MHEYLWGHVTKGSGFPSHVSWILSFNSSNTKISNFQCSMSIKQHIFCFNITVYDLLWVKIAQTAKLEQTHSISTQLHTTSNNDWSSSYPRERSKASWITILKASFFLLFLIKNFFSVPPGRYSTTTQHALEGTGLRPSLEMLFEGILRSDVPIEAPINYNRKDELMVRPWRFKVNTQGRETDILSLIYIAI